MFKQVLQQYIFYVCFLSFAESNQFASFERVQSVLGSTCISRQTPS